jgi:hypothetical protein
VIRRRDEQGSALVELTWLGILLLVPILWIVLSASEVQRGAFATSAAARAAGRAYALEKCRKPSSRRSRRRLSGTSSGRCPSSRASG